jgi:hypothetical protein
MGRRAKLRKKTSGGRLAKLHKKYRASKCDLCGATGELHTHHRDKRHYNDSPSNWLTLCPECHAKIHRAERTPGEVAVSQRGRGAGQLVLPLLPKQTHQGGEGA